MSMTHIETYTAGSAVASIEFTSIPQDYIDLIVLISGNSSDTTANTGGYDVLGIQINGATSGYSSRELRADGSFVNTTTRTTTTVGGEAYGRFSIAFKNSYGTAVGPESYRLHISNYTASADKPMSLETVGELNETNAQMSIAAPLWSNTDAITSIEYGLVTGDFVAGTTVSLYGISDTVAQDGRIEP